MLPSHCIEHRQFGGNPAAKRETDDRHLSKVEPFEEVKVGERKVIIASRSLASIVANVRMTTSCKDGLVCSVIIPSFV